MNPSDVRTADDPEVRACTQGGVEHDYRTHTVRTGDRPNAPRVTLWRCVWCLGASCGSWNEPDPCIEPRDHRVAHRTRSGLTWPVDTKRPGRPGRAPGQRTAA